MQTIRLFNRMLGERAAQLACLLALGLLAVAAVAWWNETRAPSENANTFLVALTNPPPPPVVAPDFSAAQAALVASAQPVTVKLVGTHDLFRPTLPPTREPAPSNSLPKPPTGK